MTILETIVSFFMSILFILSSIFPFSPLKTVDMDKFELVWSDEFDGDALDETKWKVISYSGKDAEVRRGGYWSKSQVSVEEGNLHISTDYYENGYNNNGMPGWYTGAVFTRDLFEQKHGYFEVRCILPKGSGMWSAFWLSSPSMSNVDGSGKDGAEIDVFESPYYGTSKHNTVSTNIHYDGYGEGLRSTNVCMPTIISSNPYEKYNTYALEWNEDEYIFYINGFETGRTDFGGASEVAEYLILSVEIGGADGVAGNTFGDNKLEVGDETTDFIVDYVRVYQYKD